MTKFSKRIQNALFWDPSGPNTSKNEISEELILSAVRC